MTRHPSTLPLASAGLLPVSTFERAGLGDSKGAAAAAGLCIDIDKELG
ncbi:hypothetical protein ENSA5_21340 [Enhygromyxa salina]|uniref:Uncharacterized protein n=1 Tax=Enhygromyxa salina TaxID=215803 RepID=A0A2S9YCQ4_9BACT|nr:hypothetical protein [Enhygromyxa salina]PRQ02781.1 hypothetical protein ENSA5_21340 [Enhygromyxa salina]